MSMIIASSGLMSAKSYDKRLICTYSVIDDTSTTTIMTMATSNVKSVEIDGTSQVVSTSYQLSIGEHEIKIGLKDSTTIPAYAFQNVTRLKEVVIPDNFTSIGRDFANGCTLLDSITISNSITSIPTNFARGTAIDTIVIPNGVTTVAANAFMNCTNLEDITIPPSVTSCGDYSFYNIKVPGIVRISDIAAWCNIQFYANRQGSNPLDYARHLYLNDTELTQITVPNGVTSSLVRTFSNGKSITHVSLPNTITVIGTSAFEGCTLSSIDMPNAITEIGTSAFRSSGILSITLPDTITTIGQISFSYMSSPKIIILATTPPALPSTNPGNVFSGSGQYYIYVPDDYIDIYKAATGWSSISSRIKGISELPT